MTNIETNTIDESSSLESVHAVADKDELVAAFSQLSNEEKTRFYKDCEEGISLEDARHAMHEKIRQLWRK